MQARNKKNQTIKLVYAIMLCAAVGGAAVFSVINGNFITSPKGIPPTVQISQDGVRYEAKVIVLDSLKYKSKIANNLQNDPVRKSDILFQQNPTFLIWTLLILFMSVAVSGGFPVYLAQDIQWIKKFKLARQQVWTSFGLSLFVIVSMAFISKRVQGLFTADEIMSKFHILLNNGEAIMKWLIFGIFILLIPAIMSIFLILPASGAAINNISEKNEIEEAADKLNSLHNSLLTTLQFLAVVVVLAGLNTSLLGNSIKATIRLETFDIFPIEMSYAYGLQFTLFLGMLYIPVYFYLVQQKNLLAEKLSGRDETWNKAILEKLSIKAGVLDTLKASLTVLAPLITSFLPEHLSIFK